MTFNNRCTNPNISLEIDGIKIDAMKKVTFLGVIIEHLLCYIRLIAFQVCIIRNKRPPPKPGQREALISHCLNQSLTKEVEIFLGQQRR